MGFSSSADLIRIETSSALSELKNINLLADDLPGRFGTVHWFYLSVRSTS